ncbi:DNA mismatch repair protein MutS core [Penicillium canariense]|uniref:DNA mismatch repair protein MSH5 n=1 Tax=Penicillium canariense TaxID=189055 RepID=A0A9W9I872_9EURO|nr:DNA mismatch repair protein MutS core [Penicillium canariense]KAJ5166787.1 DNA mismatch repair protein MutS core [Penicillium canariense]
MHSSQKKARSPVVSRRYPVTPGTSGSKACNASRVLNHAPAIPRSSVPPPTSSVTRQLQAPYPSTDTPQLADESETIDSDLGHVIAAIDMKDYGTVGCAYYSTEEEKMYLLGDSRSGGMEMVDALILQIKPTVILIPSRVNISSLRGREQSLARDNDFSSYLAYQVDVRPTQEFGFSNARNSLVALDMSSSHEDRIRFFVPNSGLAGPEEINPENMGFTLHEGRLLHMSSSIDMENPVTVGCAGAVLSHLQKRRATGARIGPMDDCPFKVRYLEMCSLRDTMWISSNTLLSLQIIQPESHPNMFNQGPGTKSASGKEGLSVYGLFHRFAYTPQGKAKLKQIFFRPSLSLVSIRQRHDFISVFSRPDNSAVLEKIAKGMKHIKNLRPVMINLRKGVSTGSAKITGFKATVWASLLAFAFYSIDIHDGLREVSGADVLPLRTKALQLFEAAQLYRVGRMIQETVDVDNSEEQGRTVVKQGLDRDLDRMKDRYDGLNSLLKHVAIDIATTIPEELDIDVNVIYFPQLGFNIAIPLNDREQPAYSGSGEDWDLVFITETRAYFKDFRMRELDDRLGDIYGLICGMHLVLLGNLRAYSDDMLYTEKEIEIVYDLAQRVLQYENVLVEASDVCGELDSLLALTQAASFYKLSRPRMVSENVIKIKGGRHILQELTVSSYVPNNALLVGGYNTSGRSPISSQASPAPSMLVLTGPNYSGKSVYMKQTALIVYLAQIGSFIPAESAELGITDKILTKINAQESVSKIQSTFMSDLQQISLCLNQVTGQSLVLIDEFGKGTNESDGIGLACGILEHLLSLEDAPKVIAATHFHEIFENGFLPPRARLQLGHMEVKVCEESQQVEDQVTYLYNFRLGRSNKSYGTICAAINGIDAAIVARANEIALLAARGVNLTAACAVLSPEETQILQEANQLARNFLKVDLSKDGAPGQNAKAILEELFTTPA